jgi:hypothetical protein
MRLPRRVSAHADDVASTRKVGSPMSVILVPASSHYILPDKEVSPLEKLLYLIPTISLHLTTCVSILIRSMPVKGFSRESHTEAFLPGSVDLSDRTGRFPAKV